MTEIPEELQLKCFGDLETVFPEGEDGLRSSPEKCLSCALKTECLKKAMSRDRGLEVREKVVDRAYDSGMMSFFERWSTKKALQRKMKASEKRKKKGDRL